MSESEIGTGKTVFVIAVVLGCFAIMAHSGILTWSSPHLAEHMGKLHCEHFSLGTSKKKKGSNHLQ